MLLGYTESAINRLMHAPPTVTLITDPIDFLRAGFLTVVNPGIPAEKSFSPLCYIEIGCPGTSVSIFIT